MILSERTTSSNGRVGRVFPSELRQPACPVLREEERNRLCELRQDPLFEEWRHLTALLGIDLPTFQLLMDERVLDGREDAPLLAGVTRAASGADGDGAGIPLAPNWTAAIGPELVPSWQGADGFAPAQYGK